ncbi:hypothetical protein [Lysobacter gummosus]|uniref:hypothetical protein n=1 Tax=Lysobacter gummosus TaxID=262324 RepID=UPI0036408C33
MRPRKQTRLPDFLLMPSISIPLRPDPPNAQTAASSRSDSACRHEFSHSRSTPLRRARIGASHAAILPRSARK